MYRILFYNAHATKPIYSTPPFELEESSTPEDYLYGVLSNIMKHGFMIFNEDEAIMAGSFYAAKIVKITVPIPRMDIGTILEGGLI